MGFVFEFLFLQKILRSIMAREQRFIGLALALSSNVFIGISYIITKKGLLNSRSAGNQAQLKLIRKVIAKIRICI